MSLFKRRTPKKPAKEGAAASTAALQADLRSAVATALTPAVASRLLNVPESEIVVAPRSLDQLFEFDPRPLGQGQMSTVYAARRRRDGRNVVAKALHLQTLMESERALLKASADATALRTVPPHPHVLNLVETACSPRQLSLIVEPTESDLLSLIENRGGRLGEPEARPVFSQLCAALEHLHHNGWAHRDLKPEHACLAPTSEGRLHVRIVDFGEAARCAPSEASLTGFCGTPLYMAPEVARWFRVPSKLPRGQAAPPSPWCHPRTRRDGTPLPP